MPLVRQEARLGKLGEVKAMKFIALFLIICAFLFICIRSMDDEQDEPKDYRGNMPDIEDVEGINDCRDE